MGDIAVRVEHVSKTFKLPHEQAGSVKNVLVGLTRRRHGYEVQEVLKDVSFDIKKGEFFGIVGRNGSGKSTLLKILAGIYSPTSGSVTVNGKLTPFIELGVGFNPELTGRENVYLNGALLGFNRKEMDAMYDDIVEFAELEKFMDQKLKNYSSGMQVRLAFSVAIRAETDILLIDEVLAVGDQSFQEKCFEYFSKIKQSNKTIIFVTHDMNSIERFCDRVFVIDKKKEINGLYSIAGAVDIYNELNHEVKLSSSFVSRDNARKDIYIKNITLKNGSGKPKAVFKIGDPMSINIDIDTKKALAGTPITVGLAIHDESGNNLAGPNTADEHLAAGQETIIYKIEKLPLNVGTYSITATIYDDSLTHRYDMVDGVTSFSVKSSKGYHGKFIIDGTWQVEA